MRIKRWRCNDGFTGREVSLLLLTFLLCWQSAVVVEAKNESEEALARARLREVCSNRVPWLTCERTKDNSDYVMMAGTFGAGVVATIINDPDRFNIDVYADCHARSKINEPLEVATVEERRVRPDEFPEIPIFLKTAQKGQIARQVLHESVALKDPFELEKKRARGLALLNMAPAVFDVRDRSTSELLLSKDFYMMQYYESLKADVVFRKIGKEMAAVWTAQGAALARAVVTQDSRAAAAAVKAMETEGWLRIRLVCALMDAVLGLVRRLWKRRFRHCDLHGGNVLFMTEKVAVPSPMFTALLQYGRGVPLTDDMIGREWTDMDKLTDTLIQRGVKEVYFAVLHPDRFRLIDLAYLTYLKQTAAAYAARHGDQSLPAPCRTAGCNRSEDTWELNRFLSRCRGSIVTNAWKAALSANKLQTLSATAFGGTVVKEFDGKVREMADLLDNLYKGVVTSNRSWSDCLKAQMAYSARYKKARATKVCRWLRRNFHKEYPNYPCTEASEMDALSKAREYITQLKEPLQRHMPDGFFNGLHGSSSWTPLPPVPGDVEAHLSAALSRTPPARATRRWSAQTAPLQPGLSGSSEDGIEVSSPVNPVA